MSIEKGTIPGPESEAELTAPGVDSTTDIHTEKQTLAGHVITTIKILGGFALVGATLWVVELWTAAG